MPAPNAVLLSRADVSNLTDLDEESGHSTAGVVTMHSGAASSTAARDDAEEEARFPSPELPDDCMMSILSRLTSAEQRNSFSLASRRCWELEASSRTHLRLGPGVKAGSEALSRLADRFTGLTSVHLDYLGWKSSAASGPQLGDDALQLLVQRCHALTHLSLSFCSFVTDKGMSHLSRCATLTSLRLHFLQCVTGSGLLSVVLGCPQLEALHVERCQGLRSSEWLEALGSLRSHHSDSVAREFKPHIAVLPARHSGTGRASLCADKEVLSEREWAGVHGCGTPPRAGFRRSLDSAAASTPASLRSLDSSPAGLSSPAQATSSLSSWNSDVSTSPETSSATPSPTNTCTTPSPVAHSSGSVRLDASPSPLRLTPPRGGGTPASASERLLGCAPAPGGLRKLCISNCRGIGEGDLAKLGKSGWERLEELRFDMDVYPRDVLLPSVAPFEFLAAALNLSRLRVLCLSHCPRTRGEGLALVLARLCTPTLEEGKTAEGEGEGAPGGCPNGRHFAGLSELSLMSCPGLNDADLRLLLSTFSASLRVLSVSLVKWLGGTAVRSPGPASPAAAPSRTHLLSPSASPAAPASRPHPLSPPEALAQRQHQHPPHQESTWAVTTASLWNIAEFCTGLEELELHCKDDFPSSAALFLGFADVAVSHLVESLGALHKLRVARGLHLSDHVVEELQLGHPKLSLDIF